MRYKHLIRAINCAKESKDMRELVPWGCLEASLPHPKCMTFRDQAESHFTKSVRSPMTRLLGTLPSVPDADWDLSSTCWDFELPHCLWGRTESPGVTHSHNCLSERASSHKQQDWGWGEASSMDVLEACQQSLTLAHAYLIPQLKDGTEVASSCPLMHS